jgi:hypothetical protein
MRIAVVVSWDGRNPGWLAEALKSIDSQSARPTQRCLVVDSPDGTAALKAMPLNPTARGWTISYGSWSDPAGARNHGVDTTEAPWLVFWDADNVMPPGFLKAVDGAIRHADANVGIVYSDIEYVDENLHNGSRWYVPDWNYWTLRASNYIDTASAWRRSAIELAGGWPCGLRSFEDYALALEVTRRGWVAVHRDGPPIVMRRHEYARSNQRVLSGERRSDLWPIRTLGILSLLAGRTSTYDRWEKFIHTAELPRHSSLYVVDNSGNHDFTRRVQQTCEDLVHEGRFDRITCSVRPHRYAERQGEPYFVRERHLHIARLYAELFPTIPEDLILTLEDDIEPPPDAIRRLAEQLGCTAWGNFAAVGAAYDMGDGVLCAGRADGGWGTRILWSELVDQAIDVGNVGGGCTLWANWALAEQPIPFLWEEGLGWDGSVCTALRQRGYRIQLHGGVRCVHHVHGAIRH